MSYFRNNIIVSIIAPGLLLLAMWPSSPVRRKTIAGAGITCLATVFSSSFSILRRVSLLVLSFPVSTMADFETEDIVLGYDEYISRDGPQENI